MKSPLMPLYCSGFKLSAPLDEDLDVTIIVKKRLFHNRCVGYNVPVLFSPHQRMRIIKNINLEGSRTQFTFICEDLRAV